MNLGEIKALIDEQEGPLAEAMALADVIEVIAIDGLSLRDNNAAVLSKMLSKRLEQVRLVIATALDRGRWAGVIG